MSDLQTQFNQAAADAQNLPSRPSNDVMIQIYALYKQATQGDAIGKRPGFTDPVGRTKYDAWAHLQGLSKETAMQDYVDLITGLKE